MTLRFGVVGCGQMGKKRIKNILEHSETKLTAVADTKKEIAKRISQKNNAAFFSDVNEMLQNKEIDSVIVCTPNKSHTEIVEKALNQNIDVFCEKPLARNPKEAKRIVKAELKSEGSLKVGSNLKYFRSVQKAKEIISNSSIGKLLYLRGWIGNSGWQLEKEWYTQPETIGGGTLLDNGSHLLDLSRWFLGEVKKCSGFTFSTYHELDPTLEDNALALFEFEEEKYASIQSSWTEWSEYMYLEIYGTEGYIRINERNPISKVTYGEKNGTEKTFDFSRKPYQSYELELQEYVRSLKKETHPKPNVLDGLRAVQMAHGVYKSEKEGKKVNLWGKEEKKLAKKFKKANKK